MKVAAEIDLSENARQALLDAWLKEYLPTLMRQTDQPAMLDDSAPDDNVQLVN
jgi:hypothetical protein